SAHASSGGPASGRTGGTSPAAPAWSIFADNPVSLARSPVVVAAPRPFAESLGWPGKQPGLADLAARVASPQIPRFSMGSPPALLAVLGVQVAMARTTPDPGIAQMRALALRARLADAGADPAVLFRRMGEQTNAANAVQEVGLFPVTEQALWDYARTTHPVPL